MSRDFTRRESAVPVKKQKKPKQKHRRHPLIMIQKR